MSTRALRRAFTLCATLLVLAHGLLAQEPDPPTHEIVPQYGDPSGGSPLFTTSGVSYASLSAEQQALFDHFSARTTTLESRLVTLNLDPGTLEAAAELFLNLFPDFEVFAMRDNLELIGGDVVWNGNTSPTVGRVTLLNREGRISGSIIAGANVIAIHPMGGRLHCIVRVDQAAFGPDDPPGFNEAHVQNSSFEDENDICDDIPLSEEDTCEPRGRGPGGSGTVPSVFRPRGPSDWAASLRDRGPGDSGPDRPRVGPISLSQSRVGARTALEFGELASGTADRSAVGIAGADASTFNTVTILVAYTPAVRNNHASVEDFVRLAVARVNASYTLSEVAPRMTLVFSTEVNYVESRTCTNITVNGSTTCRSDDLIRLRNFGDGFMDDIHARRDEHRADVVVLLVDQMQEPYIGGEAWTIMATEDTAFAVIDDEYAVDNLSFAHEVGHLQGARHNTQADPSNAPFKYGHGRYRTSKNYRTVMSYDCPGGCMRVSYWSNPDVKYLNRRTGDSTRRDNARVLDETAPIVAAFRTGTASGDNFSPAGSWTGAGDGTQGWHIGDFDGDGYDDIFRYLPGTSGADVFLSNGTRFVWNGSWTGAGSGDRGWHLGDFDGDGRTDIFRYWGGYSGADMFLSDGSRFVSAGSWTGAGDGDRGWHVGDFNGDGRDDIFRYLGGVCGADVFLSNGSQFVYSGCWTGAGDGNRGWHVGDFDGDGRDDIFRYRAGISGAEVFLSSGVSFLLDGSWTGAGDGARGWHLGDFDGDGATDIFRYIPLFSGGEVFLSSGSSFAYDGSWTGAGDGARGWHVGDFDGDGRDDIFRYRPGISGAEMYLSNP